jgi:long-subunit fatty acid transport protein
MTKTAQNLAPSLLLLSLLLGVGSAHASGMELEPGGPRSVARGGATAARPEDPMLLVQNPAGMAFLTGHVYFAALDTVSDHMCVDPYGYYGWGVYTANRSEFGDPVALDNPTHPTIGATYATTPLPKVCNSAPSSPLPQTGWAGKITDRLAMGAGFVAPVVVPGLQFGGADGTIQTAYGPRPTPTRYTLVKQSVTAASDPTVGVAYRILDQLAAGLSLQVLMIRADASAVQNQVSGTQPSTDMFARVTTQDFFVPALTFSVHAKPIAPIDLTAAFRWSDDFHGAGDVVYETNTYYRGATSGPIPYTNDPVKLADVTIKLPWQLTSGIRFHGDLPDKGHRGDPMGTELWDVEVDGSYLFNKRASLTAIRVGQDVSLVTKNADGTQGSTTVKANSLPVFNIDRHLLDVMTVRVGGSYSLLPRKLLLNAGVFYETRGVDPAYADIDTFAFQRIGVGFGAVLRLGSIDLIAGYGHIASETLDVAPPPHQNLENAKPGNPASGFDQRVGGTFADDGTRKGGVVLADPNAPSPGHADAVAHKTAQAGVATSARPNRVINAGKYTASFDVFSLGAAFHF